MHFLSGYATRLETTVPPATGPDADLLNRHRLSTLQEFDVLIQSLEALSKFLKQLTDTLPPEQVIDIQTALEAVHLGSIADRLSGQIPEISNNAAPNTELF